MRRILLHDSQKGGAPTTQQFCCTVSIKQPCSHLQSIVLPTTNCTTNAQRNDFRQKHRLKSLFAPGDANSRHANTSKPEFTLVNEDLRVEHNAEVALLVQIKIKKRALQRLQTSKTLKIHYEKLLFDFISRGSNRIRTCDPLLVRQVL